MQVKRVPIKAQDYDKVVHIDASATHWSLEHSKHSAAAMSALSTFQDMVAAKNQTVTELCKASGLDMTKVVQARLVKSTEGDHFVEVAMQDDPAPPAEAVAPEPAPAEAPPPTPAS